MRLRRHRSTAAGTGSGPTPDVRRELSGYVGRRSPVSAQAHNPILGAGVGLVRDAQATPTTSAKPASKHSRSRSGSDTAAGSLLIATKQVPA